MRARILAFLLLIATIPIARSQDLRLGQLIGHKAEISQLAFTPNGKYLFSASFEDGRIFMWDVASGKMITSSPNMPTANMVVSPDGDYVITNDYLVYLWDVRSNKRGVLTDGNSFEYFTEKSNYLVNDLTRYYENNRSNIPFRFTGERVVSLTTEFNNWSEVIRYLELDGRLYGALKDGSFWNIINNQETTGATISILEEQLTRLFDTTSVKKIEGVHAINHEKEIYAVATRDNSIEIRSTKTNNLIKVCKGHVNEWVNGKFNYPYINVINQKLDLTWDLTENTFIGKIPTTIPENTIYKRDSVPSEDDWYKAVPFHSENNAYTATCLPWWRDEASMKGYSLINNKTGSEKSLNIDKFLRQLGISNDGKFLIATTFDYDLLLYNTETEKIIGEFPGHQGTGFLSVNFSDDGKTVFSIGMDGSMILIDLISLDKKFTFYIIDEKDWLITTPSGLFDASPATMNLMYYISGREIIEFEQLKERYYEPGLFNKIMNGEPIREAEALEDLELYPLLDAEITDHVLNVKLTARSGGIGKLSLFINGKEVAEDINPDRELNLTLDIGQFSKYIPVNADNIISLRSWNEDEWLKSSPLELNYKIEMGGFGDTDLPFAVKPNLYALIVGTSDYSGEDLDLKYADKDAEYFYKAISESGAALFGSDRTSVTLLTTKSTDPKSLSSKENIEKAIQSLQRIQVNDVFIIYFSGHGISYKDQFYYLTKDIGSSEAIDDPTLRENYTISTEELTNWITSIPAQKQVLILDACSSGTFISAFGQTRNISSDQIRALDRMKDRTGMYVLAGSASDKVSYEASQYGQGVLTYSLLSGMKGRALRNNEFVDVSTLFQFAIDEVPILAGDIGGIQKPTIFYPSNATSFDIGIVNDQVDIPLEDVKPVFELSDFEEEESWDDVLKIGKAVNDHLDELANTETRGLVFIAAKDIKKAYRIKGKYVIENGQILLRCRLMKDGAKIGSFQLEGEKEDIKNLVSSVIDNVVALVEKNIMR